MQVARQQIQAAAVVVAVTPILLMVTVRLVVQEL
jgi:hypothetical protein